MSDQTQQTSMTDEQFQAIALEKAHQQAGGTVFSFPTEVVDLPSRGLLYDTNNPLSSGKIEMKYMTAKEEDILSSPNLARQGIILDKLFQSLIVTPIRYDDLYVGDRNAIMIAARLLAYGKDYTVEVPDPSVPSEKQQVTIDLTSFTHKQIDYSMFEHGRTEFTFELPISKTVIGFRFLTVGVEKQIKHEVDTLKPVTKKTGIDRAYTTRLKYIITSVDGDSDRKTINDFVDSDTFFAQDARAFREYYKSVSPDVDMKFTFISDLTREAKEMEVPIDVSFFWPKG